MKPSSTQLWKLLSGHIVAVQPILRQVTGSLEAAIFLAQSLYWTERLPAERHGWFFNSREDWLHQTSLTRCEQESARKKLKALNILEEKKCGVPCKIFFRLDLQVVDRLLQTVVSHKIAGLPPTGRQAAEDWHTEASHLPNSPESAVDCSLDHSQVVDTLSQTTVSHKIAMVPPTGQQAAEDWHTEASHLPNSPESAVNSSSDLSQVVDRLLQTVVNHKIAVVPPTGRQADLAVDSSPELSQVVDKLSQTVVSHKIAVGQPTSRRRNRQLDGGEPANKTAGPPPSIRQDSSPRFLSPSLKSLPPAQMPPQENGTPPPEVAPDGAGYGKRVGGAALALIEGGPDSPPGTEVSLSGTSGAEREGLATGNEKLDAHYFVKKTPESDQADPLVSTTELKSNLCLIFGRRVGLPWNRREERRLRELAGFVTKDLMQPVLARYLSKTEWPTRCRTLSQLLRNFSPETDRALVWQRAAVQAKPKVCTSDYERHRDAHEVIYELDTQANRDCFARNGHAFSSGGFLQCSVELLRRFSPATWVYVEARVHPDTMPLLRFLAQTEPSLSHATPASR